MYFKKKTKKYFILVRKIISLDVFFNVFEYKFYTSKVKNLF